MALLLTDDEIAQVLGGDQAGPEFDKFKAAATDLDGLFRLETPGRIWEETALADQEIAVTGQSPRLWLPGRPIDEGAGVTLKSLTSRDAETDAVTTEDVGPGLYRIEHEHGRLVYRHGCWPCGEYLVTATVGYTPAEIDGTEQNPRFPADLQAAKLLLKRLLNRTFKGQVRSHLQSHGHAGESAGYSSLLTKADREILEQLR